MSAPTSGPQRAAGPDDLASSPGRGRNRSAPGRRIRPRITILAALALSLAGCTLPTFGQYKGATTQAQSEVKLYTGTVVAGIVIGAIVVLLIVWCLLAYRRRGSDTPPRQFQYHLPLEYTYTIIPVIIVLVIFGFTYKTENSQNALAAQPATRVTVTAFQWGWEFQYPAGAGKTAMPTIIGKLRANPDPIGLDGKSCAETASTDQDCWGPGLVIPAGEPTQITLVSNDVVHDFYIPEFEYQRDAQPGIINRFDLTPQHAGIYRAQCAEICGLYHSQMYFHVVVLPPAQFQSWLASQQTTAMGAPSISTGGGAASSSMPPGYPTTTTTTLGGPPSPGAHTSPVTAGGTTSTTVTTTSQRTGAVAG